MPRKPYTTLVGRTKRKSGDESIEIGVIAQARRPELQTIIGACLMGWPFIEMELALILGQLLGSPNEAAIRVFQIIRRSTTQRDAIHEAGIHTLSSDDRDLLNAVLAVEQSVESERNALAHGHFGISSLLPYHFIWQETKDYLSHRTNVTLREQKGWNEDRHERLIQTLYVYTRSDLESIQKDIFDLGNTLHLFLRYLQDRDNNNPTISLRRRQLCDQPNIGQELKRLRHERNLLALGGRALPEPEC
jgi:hypothetical protein